jgi:hypothetical protein
MVWRSFHLHRGHNKRDTADRVKARKYWNWLEKGGKGMRNECKKEIIFSDRLPFTLRNSLVVYPTASRKIPRQYHEKVLYHGCFISHPSQTALCCLNAYRSLFYKNLTFGSIQPMYKILLQIHNVSHSRTVHVKTIWLIIEEFMYFISSTKWIVVKRLSFNICSC